ncbi:hypothetical protein [Anatilimnocola floriformis]|uniref:hypothetical protein n=1 Tax=Anatilimnocola floriformis TaxID=2948575 RepID=UPI0020C5458A|nr:hypothetical protein [Anatilimnocola floriformis]
MGHLLIVPILPQPIAMPEVVASGHVCYQFDGGTKCCEHLPKSLYPMPEEWAAHGEHDQLSDAAFAGKQVQVKFRDDKPDFNFTKWRNGPPPYWAWRFRIEEINWRRTLDEIDGPMMLRSLIPTAGAMKPAQTENAFLEHFHNNYPDFWNRNLLCWVYSVSK